MPLSHMPGTSPVLLLYKARSLLAFPFSHAVPFPNAAAIQKRRICPCLLLVTCNALFKCPFPMPVHPVGITSSFIHQRRNQSTSPMRSMGITRSFIHQHRDQCTLHKLVNTRSSLVPSQRSPVKRLSILLQVGAVRSLVHASAHIVVPAQALEERRYLPKHIHL